MNVYRNIEDLSFSRVDQQRAMLALTLEARELLSEAARNVNESFESRVGTCNRAHAMLNAVLSMSVNFDTGDKDARVRRALNRATNAASAAVSNGKIAQSYDRVGTAPENEHAPKTISIFKRAAETACTEAHRALVELCELFPEAAKNATTR